MIKNDTDLRVAIIGCGAVAENYYAPALQELVATEALRIVRLVDPSIQRAEQLEKTFPGADWKDSVGGLTAASLDLAIVASPPRFHCTQAVGLLESGVHVLCEKPMASSLAEAERMVDAARRSNTKLSIGLFRRFFPTSEAIRDLIRQQHLGRVLSVRWSEGGPFSWPAASPSFFQKSGNAGGVLADHGVHCLDLLLWWLGEPSLTQYEDDAMGGLEANCCVRLAFQDNVQAVLRLSRDTVIPNYLQIEFERGWVRLEGVNANEMLIGFPGAPYAHKSIVCRPASAHADNRTDWIPDERTQFEPAASYAQSFIRQVQDMCRAIRNDTAPRCPGEEGLLSMRLIDQCYGNRQLMKMPWMPESEIDRNSLASCVR